MSTKSTKRTLVVLAGLAVAASATVAIAGPGSAAVAAPATVVPAGAASATGDDPVVIPLPPDGNNDIAIKVVLDTDMLGFSSLVYDEDSQPDFRCPANAPWLLAGQSSPGRIVPQGVGVYEPGGIGVTSDFMRRNVPPEDYMAQFSATNWMPWTQHLKVVLYCTNNIDRRAGTDAFDHVK